MDASARSSLEIRLPAASDPPRSGPSERKTTPIPRGRRPSGIRRVPGCRGLRTAGSIRARRRPPCRRPNDMNNQFDHFLRGWRGYAGSVRAHTSGRRQIGNIVHPGLQLLVGLFNGSDQERLVRHDGRHIQLRSNSVIADFAEMFETANVTRVSASTATSSREQLSKRTGTPSLRCRSSATAPNGVPSYFNVISRSSRGKPGQLPPLTAGAVGLATAACQAGAAAGEAGCFTG